MNENVVQILWVLFAQLGVQIDLIQDNGTVNFSVPSMSDYTAEVENIFGIEGLPPHTMLAGELLLSIVNNFFEENGMIPNGRIRQDYWNFLAGQFAAEQMQKNMMG